MCVCVCVCVCGWVCDRTIEYQWEKNVIIPFSFLPQFISSMCF